MTKVDVVRAEMVKAMKAGDKERKNALSMLLSALKNATIDKRSDLTEEEADVIVRKEIKQTQETLDTTPAERTETVSYTHLDVYKRQQWKHSWLNHGSMMLLSQ